MEAEIWWMASVAGCLGQIRRVRVTKATDATVWIKRSGGFVHKNKRIGKNHFYHPTLTEAVFWMEKQINKAVEDK